MNFLEYIINPILGGTIGLFTNWLAIKMLFSPHYEKKIFGIKLPFTPGLIPKERGRLAEKIGDTLTANVLTDDALIEAIDKPEVRAAIDNILINSYEKLKHSDIEFRTYAGENFDIYKRKFVGTLLSYSKDYIGTYENKEKISNFISNFIIDKLENLDGVIDKEKLVKTFINLLSDILIQKINSDSFEDDLSLISTKIFSNTVTDKKLNEFLSKKQINSFKMFILDNLPTLVSKIRDFPENNIELDNQIKQMVTKIASEQFGSFVGIFINYDKLYSNIKSGLFDYLENKDNQDLIIVKLYELLDNLMNENLSELLDKFSNEHKTIILDLSVKHIKKIKTDDVNSFFEKHKNKLDEIDISNLLEKISPDYRSRIYDIVYSTISDFIENNYIDIATIGLDYTIDRLGTLTTKKICGTFDDSQFAVIKEKFITHLFVLIRKGSSEIIHALDLAKLVEDKINDLSIEEAEKIVLDVAKKELNMITYLGGILGFIIGLVPVITKLLFQ